MTPLRERIAEIKELIDARQSALSTAEAKYGAEKQVVTDILDLRAQLSGETSKPLPVDDPQATMPDAAPEAIADAADEATWTPPLHDVKPVLGKR